MDGRRSASRRTWSDDGDVLHRHRRLGQAGRSPDVGRQRVDGEEPARTQERAKRRDRAEPVREQLGRRAGGLRDRLHAAQPERRVHVVRRRARDVPAEHRAQRLRGHQHPGPRRSRPQPADQPHRHQPQPVRRDHDAARRQRLVPVDGQPAARHRDRPQHDRRGRHDALLCLRGRIVGGPSGHRLSVHQQRGAALAVRRQRRAGELRQPDHRDVLSGGRVQRQLAPGRGSAIAIRRGTTSTGSSAMPSRTWRPGTTRRSPEARSRAARRTARTSAPTHRGSRPRSRPSRRA